MYKYEPQHFFHHLIWMFRTNIIEQLFPSFSRFQNWKPSLFVSKSDVMNKIKEDLPLTFWYKPLSKHSSCSSSFQCAQVCCPLKWSFKARMEGKWEVQRVMWGLLLLHFIRTLILRLFNGILCLYPLCLCSPPQRQDDRTCREAGGVGRGSVRFTSHHFS